MKKNYSIVSLVQAFIIIALSILFPVTVHSQDLTEAQRQERCQNNKNRIAALEAEIKKIDADLSIASTEKEIKDMRAQIAKIKHFHKSIGGNSEAQIMELKMIAAKHNYNINECLNRQMILLDEPTDKCYVEFVKLIEKKIDKAIATNRPALLAKKAEIDKQLATHRNNLLKWGCDQPTDKEKMADISGTWTYATEWVYTIAQNGSKFTWYLAKIKQKAEGTITGKSVSATWFYQDGSAQGSATGTVKVDASGRAIQIDWSNGVVFKRN